MIDVIVLDTSVLGLLVHRRSNTTADAYRAWLERYLEAGVRILIPEIVDYELRRELILNDFAESVTHLDSLIESLEYLPITTAAIRRAAVLWAQVRKEGKPTADPKALDGDVILTAQVLLLRIDETRLVIATTNVGHLSRFTNAQHWRDLTPPL